jgi:peptidoglycan hydrolase-like amidase
MTMMNGKKSAAYEKLDKQEEKIEDRKKAIKSMEMEKMIRGIVRSEMAKGAKPKAKK